ncbi:hypothetical protein ACVIW2_004295 [Bradyrhizobium huanghuaihaiense]|jgi:hypothetical protein|uniref:Bll1790 protein n=8 Tax=Bradyrhizobium TaxID=374 RepID=H7C6G1_BRADU|nr:MULTISPECIES: hypothetical protein [Bradyrhizobium]AAG60774.1 ID170 [Bradyrhizobium japonicum]AJA65601.1 hypothetical protein RN69_39025 [Bradyrhizobium japonicum]AND87396.1 hypothetical protein AAV28_05870 [Bradyrhizobium diazoefficiens USDA 110]APG15226.1 hypothetical protein BKD09_43700 [Bradyrhizobium japonicum]APO50408.1 hypothetical protein BD122_09180 [Bradyrhizobium diazoefficiens]
MLATPIYIICSPSPQVGKTLIARAMSEFLLLKDGTTLSFDVNLKEPSLLDYLPNITETADVIDTYGKMQLMDPLIVHDRVPKVIDLGFHAFDEFFKMCEEIGFVKETARCCVTPVVLFVAGADRISFRGYEMLRRRIPPASLVIIHNEFALRGGLPEAMDGDRVIRISALPLFLKRYIDRLGFSFTGYLRNEKDWSTELHQWIRRNYGMFRDLDSSVTLRRWDRPRGTDIGSLRCTRAT